MLTEKTLRGPVGLHAGVFGAAHVPKAACAALAWLSRVTSLRSAGLLVPPSRARGFRAAIPCHRLQRRMLNVTSKSRLRGFLVSIV